MNPDLPVLPMVLSSGFHPQRSITGADSNSQEVPVFDGLYDVPIDVPQAKEAGFKAYGNKSYGFV